MKTLQSILFSFLILLTAAASSQTISGKVVNAKTGNPIPFATLETGQNQGVITNENGLFTVHVSRIKSPKDSIYVSSMGFETKGITYQATENAAIELSPKAFELQQVFVSSQNLSAEEIIEKVKKNLTKNYTVATTKKKIFFRQSDLNRMQKVDFGFQKSTIAELNKALIDSIAGLVPRKSAYYKEVVGDFYGDYHKHKLFIDKAAELYDKTKDVSMDGLSDKLERIFKENVKPDSYLKIKSGIFGTKVQLDSLADADEDAKAMKAEVEKNNEKQHYFQQNIKDRVSELYEALFFNEDSKLDILDKSNRYKFELQNYTFIDGEPVFILSFEPKGKKDFKGTMYVNTADFAVMRLEFDNVRPLRRFGLLGIKYRQNVYRGKMLFMKDLTGGYSPRYIELEDGNFFGVDRPLKVIEKNKHVKGRRKQNELSLELDVQINNVQKYELVVFDSEEISTGAYDSATENKDMEATYLSSYDPNFWTGYTIMEPNAAIQSFTVLDE